MTVNGMQRLRVSGNNRFLERGDGTLFFWLGDTAWELFHRLDRDEAKRYLVNRAGLGFNVIQAVALAEFEGATTPNAHGRLPFKAGADGMPDPLRPDMDGPYSYWDHVDYIVDAAAELGLYVALLPTWGDKFHQAFGFGPEILNLSNARAYGEWIGARYRDRANIVWVLGGDRWLTTRTHFDLVNEMAEGLAAGDDGSHLMTFHPPGGQTSSTFMHREPWLDFNMIQSGHRHLGERQSDRLVAADYARTPVKPVLDGEPCYEDHPRDHDAEKNGYFDAADVRTAAYYAVLSGAFGHTYGHNSVWSMAKEAGDRFIMTWEQALDRPGAMQMGHLRNLIETRTGPGRMPDPAMIEGNRSGANRMAASRDAGCALLYSPNGIPFYAALDRLEAGLVRASWSDPRSGGMTDAGEYRGKGTWLFVPPSSGRGEDWVLVLEADPLDGEEGSRIREGMNGSEECGKRGNEDGRS
ncbi:DUF4038 domain-containing protein [Paenibacillus rhizovicinus]|uniref:DUF4038 domain-containing protein n=1 Tax=Paenibacillus rhizovicinus TaxID=2704463 RepID=A0A6C0NXA1_9BACL|nr:glycoside hydrolase family 140 protein [Paenibacillus rhizovicinus]QHW30808.1 DUF4038 domain-containing protein [Paenibacillus rhizovicinus]